MQQTTLGTALGLGYSAIAVLAQNLKALTQLEDQDQNDTGALEQAVHELREVDLPDQATGWLAGLHVAAPIEAAQAPGPIEYAIGIFGAVRARLIIVRRDFEKLFAQVPADLDALLTEMDDDIMRLDAVEIPE